jgi:hypothetical protein
MANQLGTEAMEYHKLLEGQVLRKVVQVSKILNSKFHLILGQSTESLKVVPTQQ